MTTVFDNPRTMCREWWFNGVLQEAVSTFLLTEASRHHDNVYSGPAWVAGRIVGDPSHIAESERPSKTQDRSQ